MVVNGIETRMPTRISTGKAMPAVASHSTGRARMPRSCSVSLTMPYWPCSDQRQTIAVMVSETAQGSMMITRISPRPMKVVVQDERNRQGQ